MIYSHIYRFEDFMFASRHTFLIHTGHTPQGPSWKHALQTEPPAVAGLGSRIWGGKCSHSMNVSIKGSTQIRATLMLHKGSRCKCSIPQHFTSSRVMEQQQTQTAACRGLCSQSSAQLLCIDVSLQCQWRYWSNQPPAARNYSSFPYPEDN